MGKSWLALFGIATLTACVLNRSGAQGTGSNSGGSDNAGGAEADGGGGTGASGGAAGGAGGAGGLIAAGGAGGGVAGAGGEAAGGMGGSAPDPTSCVEAVGPSGLFTIDPDGAGSAAPFMVYCEQDLAGGGWTLIGRSEAGGTGDMGWGVNSGVVTGTGPYSLAPVAAGLPVDRILLVSRENGLQAYTIDLPNDFVAQHGGSSWNTGNNVTHVTGNCVPSGKPSMLTHAGRTNKSNVFFFRDVSTAGLDFGLFADGFNLHYGACSGGGGLHNTQGELYVK